MLPFIAWSSRFTSFRGLCQFSTGSSFRRRTRHPDTAGFVRPAMGFMNLFSTRKFVSGEMCIGAGLAEAFSTFLGPEDGDEAGAAPRFMWNEDHLERRGPSSPDTPEIREVPVEGRAELGGL